MATKKQFEFYKTLCEELGQEAEEDFINLPLELASKQISELKIINDSKKSIDDTCYWY